MRGEKPQNRPLSKLNTCGFFVKSNWQSRDESVGLIPTGTETSQHCVGGMRSTECPLVAAAALDQLLLPLLHVRRICR